MAGPAASDAHEFGDATAERARRQRLIDQPGPSWRVYFYRSFVRAWTLCFFFVADVWIVVSWISPWRELNLLGILLTVVLAAYLEFLAYQFLWYEPGETSRSTHERFHRAWNRPVEYGRWSEAREEAIRRGPIEHAVDPSEFL